MLVMLKGDWPAAGQINGGHLILENIREGSRRDEMKRDETRRKREADVGRSSPPLPPDWPLRAPSAPRPRQIASPLPCLIPTSKLLHS